MATACAEARRIPRISAALVSIAGREGIHARGLSSISRVRTCSSPGAIWSPGRVARAASVSMTIRERGEEAGEVTIVLMATSKRSPARKPAGTKAPPKGPKMPAAGAKTVKRFEALAEPFEARGAKRSKMFGMPVLKAGDKVFAGTFGDAMTFKLGPEDLEKAKTHSGVEAFEPMKGRPMKEWVLVPLAHATRWPDLAERAFSYVT